MSLYEESIKKRPNKLRCVCCLWVTLVLPGAEVVIHEIVEVALF